MECRECKYVTEHNGAFFCKAQKNMPYVTGNGVCEHWKPTYITNYDRIISKTPEELAAWIVEIADCDECEEMHGFRMCDAAPDKACEDCWLDWLRREAKEDE